MKIEASDYMPKESFCLNAINRLLQIDNKLKTIGITAEELKQIGSQPVAPDWTIKEYIEVARDFGILEIRKINGTHIFFHKEHGSIMVGT